jgi:hypothetical protein
MGIPTPLVCVSCAPVACMVGFWLDTADIYAPRAQIRTAPNR